MANLANYQIVADSHNVMNTGTSWTDPASWEKKLGNAGKFIATSLISGANSFYNTAIAVGNFAGLDVKENDTQRFITSLDSDWGQYYRANKELVDLTGFVAGSIIPGLGGTKLFNMGQEVIRTAVATGKITGPLARATGLLTPRTAYYLDEAKDAITTSLATQGVMNARTYQAMAAGLWQNTLEAAAAETMVTAVMFKSPVLDDMEIGDIAKNVATGALLGGVIGGSIDAAKTVGVLRGTMRKVDELRLPWTKPEQYAAATPAADLAIQKAFDLDALAVPILRTATDAAENAKLAKEYEMQLVLYNKRVSESLDGVRKAINDASGSDVAVGNALADMASPIRNADGTVQVGTGQRLFEGLSGAVHIAAPGRLTKAEQVANKAMKLAGEGPLEDPIAIRFVKLHGHEMGDITEEVPAITTLGDRATSIDHAYKQARSAGFTLKETFDMGKLSALEDYQMAQRRYVWAASLKEIKPGTLIHATDIPLLNRALKDRLLDIKIVRGTGPDLEVTVPGTIDELAAFIRNEKVDLANKIHLDQYKRYATSGNFDANAGAMRAATIADVNPNFLMGKQSANIDDDLFYSQTLIKKHQEYRAQRGLGVDASYDPFVTPSVAKVVYKLDRNLIDAHPHILDAIVHYKQQQKAFEQSARNVTSRWLGPVANQLPEFDERTLLRLNRDDPAAGLLTSANAGYGTPGSVSTQVGKVTAGIEQQWAKDAGDALQAPLVKLGQKPEAAIEFEALSIKVDRSTLRMVPYEYNGERMLVDRTLVKAVEAADGEIDLAELLKEGNHFTVKHQETWDAIMAHTGRTQRLTKMRNERWAALGKSNEMHDDVFVPIRPDPRDYPYYAFVYDDRVTNSGHVAMIHAASEKELAELIDRVPTHYSVTASPDTAKRITTRTKLDVERYQKARDAYDYDRTLNENYINSELKSKGVYASYFPKTDPQKIINDVMQYHIRAEKLAAKETVRLHYQPVFDMMESMGARYSELATSKIAGSVERIQAAAANPYFNQIKTALNISTANENHLIYGANKALDETVSKAFGAISKLWQGVKSPEQLDVINRALDSHGIKPAYYDAALEALSNHTAPRGVLTNFVRKANAMLSLFTLGLDPLNAVNNAIGSNILRGPELAAITRAIKNGNTELAGDLAALAKIRTPGTGDEILAPSKLVANAIEALAKDGAKGPLKARYRQWGIIKDQTEQLALLVDDFTLKGTEGATELAQRADTAWNRIKGRLSELAEGGQKITGNTFAEEANRFISANVMDQLTSVAIKHGVMDERTAQAYINTFVNRVEGSIIASQRPGIFQGPIGQAIGLFQRYQFNLLQQMFRYVSEGSRKDVAMVMGLQGTLYGLQGLPAFQFINTHIVGQLSGNTEHRDLYDYTYGVVGKTAADWVMYGVPSNILHANLYTRGDVNPRHLTILPTNLQEIPLVQGWGKFLGSIAETTKKIGLGGDAWESILQGVEHNGISRPLAGLAQVAQGFGEGGKVYGTSNQGSILQSNDLLSFATIVRLAGGRPLDEARLNDAMHRVQVYKAADNERRKALGEAIKTTMIGGGNPSADQIEAFAAQYAKYGGKQENFNRYMMGLYKNATVPQAEQLEMNLKSPFSQKIQLLMGGSDD